MFFTRPNSWSSCFWNTLVPGVCLRCSHCSRLHQQCTLHTLHNCSPEASVNTSTTLAYRLHKQICYVYWGWEVLSAQRFPVAERIRGVDTEKGDSGRRCCGTGAPASAAWPAVDKVMAQIPIRLRQYTALCVQLKCIGARQTIIKLCFQDSSCLCNRLPRHCAEEDGENKSQTL